MIAVREGDETSGRDPSVVLGEIWLSSFEGVSWSSFRMSSWMEVNTKG